MSRIALCDTGFWIGLFDDLDDHSEESETVYNLLTEAKYDIVAPWPTLYEFLNTRFFRRDDWIKKFQYVQRSGNLKTLSDVEYRQIAFDKMFFESRIYRKSSLVDLVIREMLRDPNIRVSVLITFNIHDFSDVCQSRNIEMFPSE
jgi:predicted nucleic acid-binding protein